MLYLVLTDTLLTIAELEYGQEINYCRINDLQRVTTQPRRMYEIRCLLALSLRKGAIRSAILN